MKGLKQTLLEPPHGNALQACVASILMRPDLSSVPNFAAEPDPYSALREFLAPLGLGFTKVGCFDGALEFAPVGEGGCWCVIAGPSPRGDHRHAVVGRARGKALVAEWDPHPDGRMLAGPAVWCGLFVALDPSERVAAAAAAAAAVKAKAPAEQVDDGDGDGGGEGGADEEGADEEGELCLACGELGHGAEACALVARPAEKWYKTGSLLCNP